MKHKLWAIFTIAIMIVSICPTVFATESANLQRHGSISVTLIEQDDNTPIAGAELALYRIADVFHGNDGAIQYRYTTAFENCDFALTDSDLAKKLEGFVENKSIDSTKMTTDSQGKVVFPELDMGLYLVIQSNTVSGYSPCKPFIVSLPLETNGVYQYDVDASPKTEMVKLTTITIQKVWNKDETTSLPGSITVQLLLGNDVIRTAILTAKNDWKVTYENMVQSDEYTVREENVPEGYTATYQKNGYNFTVTNTAPLIQTGQLNWPIPVLTAMGLLLIAVGVVVLQRGKRKNA